MALDAGAETFLVCGIGGKKHVRGGVFTHLRGSVKCENSTALRSLLLVLHVFTYRQVSMTFLKTVQSLVHAQGQTSFKQARPRQ
jgi:hypothetical protein